MVVLGTAHPAKFPAAVEGGLPASSRACPRILADLHERPERFTVLPNDLGAIESLRAPAMPAPQPGARRA